MNISVNSLGQSMAMDGQTNYVNKVDNNPKAPSGYKPPENVNAEAATTAKYLAEDLDQVKKQISQQISEIQKISDMIGRRLQFRVNEELNRVIVKIVDPNTNQVIKEIPSEEMQKLQLRIRENINFLVDEKA
ncbi:MAG: flagellar protein FlaG [Treponemataceae bacterium]|nr:flagellar protein FlaG [Treponemataceae bacterium]